MPILTISRDLPRATSSCDSLLSEVGCTCLVLGWRTGDGCSVPNVATVVQLNARFQYQQKLGILGNWARAVFVSVPSDLPSSSAINSRNLSVVNWSILSFLSSSASASRKTVDHVTSFPDRICSRWQILFVYAVGPLNFAPFFALFFFGLNDDATSRCQEWDQNY